MQTCRVCSSSDVLASELVAAHVSTPPVLLVDPILGPNI